MGKAFSVRFPTHRSLPPSLAQDLGLEPCPFLYSLPPKKGTRREGRREGGREGGRPDFPSCQLARQEEGDAFRGRAELCGGGD